MTIPRPMSDQLERAGFIAQIVRLERRIAELEAVSPGAVAARGRAHSIRKPGSALGALTFEEAVRAHRPRVTTLEIAAAAGVTCPSVSRWRAANGMVSAWVFND